MVSEPLNREACVTLLCGQSGVMLSDVAKYHLLQSAMKGKKGKVVERPNSGRPTDRVPGRVVTVDEFRTSRVSSILNSPQPCEEELDSSKPTRPEG
ncbi:hypothetical protein HaLaN_04445 [Haematococcus lacustris]|uniref:Uncharacterized protein n=1 Tax=Haematococcus lacustris TaxID=44745 RepID=A0A699Z1S0_HAELA|nr:hypothetical protein HaLaN_04445 [Haematococcus lacustris]